jgi:hypothetical protein
MVSVHANWRGTLVTSAPDIQIQPSFELVEGTILTISGLSGGHQGQFCFHSHTAREQQKQQLTQATGDLLHHQ